jgi:hypothetical protein
MTIYKNPLDIITAGYSLPDGYDSWGIKSVGFDGRTKHGFQWPEPGKATAVYPLDDHGSSCPRRKGDGLCVATTWAGMASGGYRAFCILLVAYRAAETRGNEAGKLRCPQVFVVDRLDGESLVRRNLQGADLRAANLRGANLRGADLRDANLQDANLRDADLQDANLWGANLWGANLWDANLWGANLQDANLQDANLRGANLWGADLWGADLRGADLRGANLRDAEMEKLRERGAVL